MILRCALGTDEIVALSVPKSSIFRKAIQNSRFLTVLLSIYVSIQVRYRPFYYLHSGEAKVNSPNLSKNFCRSFLKKQ